MEGASCEVEVECGEQTRGCVEGRTGDRQVPCLDKKKKKRARRDSEASCSESEQEGESKTMLVILSGVHINEKGDTVQHDSMEFWLEEVPCGLASNNFCFQNKLGERHEPHTDDLRDLLSTYGPGSELIVKGAQRAITNAYWTKALEELRKKEREEVAERLARGDDVAPAYEAYNREEPLQKKIASDKVDLLSVEELQREVVALDLVNSLDQEFSTLLLPANARFATKAEAAAATNANTLFVTIVYTYTPF
jgi:hypothetical protein